jgi:hypothetical protein
MLVGLLFYALTASWKPGQSTTVLHEIDFFFTFEHVEVSA